jgi:hypothetical protein
VIDAFNDFETSIIKTNEDAHHTARQISEFWEIFGSPTGPTKDDLTLQTSRPELTAEASSCLIASLSRSSYHLKEHQSYEPEPALLEEACKVLMLCLSRNDDISIEASSKAISQLWYLIQSSKQDELMQGWLSHIRTTRNLPTGRGHISILGSIFSELNRIN